MRLVEDRVLGAFRENAVESLGAFRQVWVEASGSLHHRTIKRQLYAVVPGGVRTPPRLVVDDSKLAGRVVGINAVHLAGDERRAVLDAAGKAALARDDAPARFAAHGLYRRERPEPCDGGFALKLDDHRQRVAEEREMAADGSFEEVADCTLVVGILHGAFRKLVQRLVAKSAEGAGVEFLQAVVGMFSESLSEKELEGTAQVAVEDGG